MNASYDPMDDEVKMGSVDWMLWERATRALADNGVTALDFMASNPGASKIELARRLNRGASALGLELAILLEAAQRGVVREVAMDLLIRQILQAFPEGWSSEGNVHPIVKIGSWDYTIAKCLDDRQIHRFAGEVVKRLTIDSPPPEGWKPELEHDPLIEDFFDRCWPTT